MASSILFAYVRTYAQRTPNWREKSTDIYIPITNVRAADISLRPEFLALFPLAGIQPTDLITLDDMPPPAECGSCLKPGNTDWILIDHNALQGQLGKMYQSRIAGVIDHHEDEGFVPQDTGDEPRMIDKSGSCASLVTQHCREPWEKISRDPGPDQNKDDDFVAWDAQLAKLALAPILIDTANLTWESKVTAHDVRAVEYLESKLARLSPDLAGYDRGSFYQNINTAKQNIGGLATNEILRKDYKEWTEKGDRKLGISSVVRSLEWLAEHETSGAPAGKAPTGLGTLLREFAEERDLSLYAIMTAFTAADGDFRRELLVWARDAGCIPVLERFREAADAELGLERWQGKSLGMSGDGHGLTIWRQHEVGKSRKQVAPLLRRCVEETFSGH